jgi:glycosyltransferase involved in cell wall biosynthesis
MIYVVAFYYLPVSNPGANRMGHLVRALIERYGADQVRVVTGRPNYPDGKLRPEDKWRLFRRARGSLGETVDHLYEFPAAFRGLYRKTFGMLTFAASVFLYFLFRRVRSDDLVIVTSGPVFPAYAIYYLRRLKRRLRYVVDVRDLWPQIVAGMGFLGRETRLYRFLLALSDRTYRAAEAAVGVTEGIVDHLRGARRDDRVHLLYNPVDTALFKPLAEEDRLAFRRAHPEIFGDGRRTVFLFSGSFSITIDLFVLIAAVKRAVAETRDIVVLLIGYGEQDALLKACVEREGLSSVVRFLPFMQRAELSRYIDAAHFCFSRRAARRSTRS